MAIIIHIVNRTVHYLTTLFFLELPCSGSKYDVAGPVIHTWLDLYGWYHMQHCPGYPWNQQLRSQN